MIYTSYFGNAKKLNENGIEIVSVSRGKPKWFLGRTLDCLAPTWNMLKMTDEEYDIEYNKILARNDAKKIVAFLGEKDVALCCWERDKEDCHRLKIAEWLKNNGYEVKEFGEEEVQQLSML